MTTQYVEERMAELKLQNAGKTKTRKPKVRNLGPDVKMLHIRVPLEVATSLYVKAGQRNISRHELCVQVLTHVANKS